MKLLFKTTFILYITLLLWLVLFKFSLDLGGVFEEQIRTINLIPFVDITTSLLGTIENGLIFVPFGLLLGVNFKHFSPQKMLTIMFCFSLGVEITQYVFGIGITDITDVIMNTAGGLFGLWLYRLGERHMKSKQLDWFIIASCLVIFAFILSTLFSHRVRIEMGHTHNPAAKTTQLLKNTQLAWPQTGQSAIGTVEDGLLASSSRSETAQPTASMAKIITALAVLKKHPLDTDQSGPVYTITPSDVADYRAYASKNGSVLPVKTGTTLTMYQALQAMLLPSANNMADLLAERTFGSEEAYIDYADTMLKTMGLTHTTITDASGFNSATVSTPSELVIIGIAALNNPVIAQIVAQQQALLPGVGLITNTNKLLGSNGVIGIKTGTTDEAGTCLLFAAKTDQQKTIVGVIMGDTSENQLFTDSENLLQSVEQALASKNGQFALPALPSNN